MKSILFLDEITSAPEMLPWVGGKAQNLARLRQAGFAVPTGFCLTGAAFQRFLSENGLEAHIEQILNRDGLDDEARAAEIRAAVVSAPIPDDVAVELRQAYASLSEDGSAPLTAVRSSAQAEDGAALSFAGQHETLLDICGEQTLFDGVRSCWASLWSARALSYRRKHGLLNARETLPLLVQQMIAADAAGVAFTADPRSGDPVIIIEAVTGTGEALVSGLVSPARFRVDKATLQVIDSTAAENQSQVLTLAQVRRLAELAIDLERFEGKPQDLEWAFASGELFLLQSRPITALPAADLLTSIGQVDMEALLHLAQERGSEIWTDDNVGEVFPGPVTPLTWSVVEPMGNLAFCSFLRRLGIQRYPKQGLFGRFYGRVYFNQTQFQHTTAQLYPSRQDSKRKTNAVLLSTALWAGVWLPLLLGRAFLAARRTPGLLRRAALPRSLSMQELRQETSRRIQEGQRLMDTHLSVTIFAALLYALLDKLVRVWSHDRVDPAHLTAGLEGMLSAEMGHDLAALARLAACEPALHKALSGEDDRVLESVLNALPASNPFRGALNDFIEKHGHNSLQEFELAFPRWREQPLGVLGLLRPHLLDIQSGQAASDPIKLRREAAAQMRRQLGLRPRRLFFELLLSAVQKTSVARENLKYSFVMSHAHLRALYLELASRLVRQGKLNGLEDIFYLTDEEASLLLDGQISPPLAQQKVQLQRRQHEENLRHGPAARLLETLPDGSVRPLFLPAHQPASGNVGETANGLLHGVAASAGLFSGRARVIQDPSETAHLRAGEVLVARATNPAWAPLLLSAGALVTEVGGLLSHGAIVAREYGLPAVLNVPHATSQIRTGQMVQVDGSAGTVRILELAQPE